MRKYSFIIENQSKSIYKITGAILGCFGKNKNKFNYKITEKLDNDPWIAIIESKDFLTLDEVKSWHKYHVVDVDKKGVPYYFIVKNNLTNEEYVWYTDDKEWLPINTKQEKDRAKQIGLKKKLVPQQLDF